MKLPTRILKLLLEQERPLTIAALSAAVGHDEKIRELVTHLAGAGLVRQLDGKGPAQFVVTKDGIDAYYERGLAPWDLAAGALIAAEAGARVADLDGTVASGEGVLAAHPDRFDDLAACLLAAGAPQA